MVLWSCSNDMDEGPYPSSAEAALATALWHRLEATTAYSMKVSPSPFKMQSDGVLVKQLCPGSYSRSLALDPFPTACSVHGPGQMNFGGPGAIGQCTERQTDRMGIPYRWRGMTRS